MTGPPPGADSAGAPSDRFRHVGRLLSEGVSEGIFPGAACVVLHQGRPALREVVGVLGGDGSAPVDFDSCYDLASLTKPLCTALLTLMAVEEGRLVLSDPVERYLPEWGAFEAARATVKHLLTHTSGLPPWRPLYEGPPSGADALESALSAPLEAAPGDRYAYSDLGYILLGRLLERLEGQSLDQAFRQKITEPLGLRATGFWRLDKGSRKWTGDPSAEAALPSRTAFTCDTTWRKRELRAEVHDANAAFLGGVAGHAGLFSTVEEVALLAELVRREGQVEDKRLLSPPAARLALERLIPRKVGGHTAGWFTSPNPLHLGADLASKASVSHSGFTGTSVLLDPPRGLTVVLLSNAVYRGTGRHIAFRRQLHNACLAAIG